MAYLQEFRGAIATRNLPKIMQLWEEYCQGDAPLFEEICEILKLIKISDFSIHIGPFVDALIPLIQTLPTEEEKFGALMHVFDIQTSNSLELSNIATSVLKKKWGDTPLFNEKLRLIGLRGGTSCQGALSNFLLLNHFEKGNFVIHTAGWGVGQITDVSFLREQVAIEFEHIRTGKKEISFKNGFKTLIPIPKTHFLAQRFDDPDQLEKRARETPQEVIKQLLTDLGPKTAAEIKEELADLVIPEKEYSKWWQAARPKLKKEPNIESPENQKEPFRLCHGHASWEERIEKALLGKNTISAILSSCYSLIRDFPQVLKIEEAKARIIEKITVLQEREKLDEAQSLELLLFLENPLGVQVEENELKKKIVKLRNIADILNRIEIVSLKKRLLAAIAQFHENWQSIFIDLLVTVDPAPLKDLILKELSTPDMQDKLKKRIRELIESPKKYPAALLWYFQKILANDAPFFSSGKDKFAFFEALMTLFGSLGYKEEERDLAKKIYHLLTKDRFLVVRNFLKESSVEYAKEFLLLAAKAHTFSDHDKKIVRSLVEVVHPQLAKGKKESVWAQSIWTSQEGYNRVHERIKLIGTRELVDVAREIEQARSHGDLRENAEYKAAQERRSRLQHEMKMLSDQMNKARIIMPDDISTTVAGIGAICEILTPKGEKKSYTILGPWDADPDKNILSFQSKFAQAMEGKKVGEKFPCNGEDFKILSIKSFLE